MGKAEGDVQPGAKTKLKSSGQDYLKRLSPLNRFLAAGCIAAPLLLIAYLTL